MSTHRTVAALFSLHRLNKIEAKSMSRCFQKQKASELRLFANDKRAIELSPNPRRHHRQGPHRRHPLPQTRCREPDKEGKHEKER